MDEGIKQISVLQESDLISLSDNNEINSLRVYINNPDNYLSDVVCVIYPKNTPVLDMADLIPKLKEWINSTDQSMGTWTSKETIEQDLQNINTSAETLIQHGIDIEYLNDLLTDNDEVYILGFDKIQIPVYKIVYKLNNIK